MSPYLYSILQNCLNSLATSGSAKMTLRMVSLLGSEFFKLARFRLYRIMRHWCSSDTSMVIPGMHISNSASLVNLSTESIKSVGNFKPTTMIIVMSMSATMTSTVNANSLRYANGSSSTKGLQHTLRLQQSLRDKDQ